MVYVNLAGQGLGLDLPGVFTPLLTYEFGEITASAVVRKTGADIEQLVLELGGRPHRRLGPRHPGQEVRRRARDHAGCASRAAAAGLRRRPTPWIDFRMDAEIACEGTLQPLRLEGTFDFGVSELRVGDRPIARKDAEMMLHIPHGNARGTIGAREGPRLPRRADRARTPLVGFDGESTSASDRAARSTSSSISPTPISPTSGR